MRRDPLQSVRPWDVQRVRKQVALMELETQRFYSRGRRAGHRRRASPIAGRPGRPRNAATRSSPRISIPPSRRSTNAKQEAQTARQLFVLQIVQPGLAGLMDGSVSTLAPLFAAAFATRDHLGTFLVGLAASVGAGISMGFAEALSDDGSLTGRGHPWMRGLVCGLMTLAGGMGHALPFLIPHVLDGHGDRQLHGRRRVGHHRLDPQPLHGQPFRGSVFQVVVGGVLVFLTGVLIGIS